jgi:predicted CopG family antitoxin
MPKLKTINIEESVYQDLKKTQGYFVEHSGQSMTFSDLIAKLIRIKIEVYGPNFSNADIKEMGRKIEEMEKIEKESK